MSDSCPATCGGCQADVSFNQVQDNSYCKSVVGGRTVIKELQARGAQDCAGAVQQDTSCSGVYTASQTFCACVLRGESCDSDASIHGNAVYVVANRLSSCLSSNDNGFPPMAGGAEFEGEAPFLSKPQMKEPILSRARIENKESPKSNSNPVFYIVLIFAMLLIIAGGLVYFKTQKHNHRVEPLAYYVSSEA